MADEVGSVTVSVYYDSDSMRNAVWEEVAVEVAGSSAERAAWREKDGIVELDLWIGSRRRR